MTDLSFPVLRFLHPVCEHVRSPWRSACSDVAAPLQGEWHTLYLLHVLSGRGHSPHTQHLHQTYEYSNVLLQAVIYFRQRYTRLILICQVWSCQVCWHCLFLSEDNSSLGVAVFNSSGPAHHDWKGMELAVSAFWPDNYEVTLSWCLSVLRNQFSIWIL